MATVHSGRGLQDRHAVRSASEQGCDPTPWSTFVGSPPGTDRTILPLGVSLCLLATAIWETSTVSGTPTWSKQYDLMASAYAAKNEVSAFNAYYERPATIELLGDVRGLRVLEAGCGAGPLTEWLIEHGATVTAFDVSSAMVDLARARVCDGAELLVADLAEPLSFAGDGSFDLVVASLVLHYVENWVAVFGEFHRVLVLNGGVVFSTHHPTADARAFTPDDYFATKVVSERWDYGDGIDVSFWRRPLSAMTGAIAQAGFVISELVEPDPAPELETIDPGLFQRFKTEPQFLFFRLRKCDAT